VGATEVARPLGEVVVSATETQAFAHLALRWHRTGHYDRARTMYELVLKTNPSPEMTFNLAVCLIRVGDYESALLRLAELQGEALKDPALRYNARYNRALAHRYLAHTSASQPARHGAARVPAATLRDADAHELDLALQEAEVLAQEVVTQLIAGDDTAVAGLAAPALVLYNAVLFEVGRVTPPSATAERRDLTRLATALLLHEPALHGRSASSEKGALKRMRSLMSARRASLDPSDLLAAVPAYVRTYRPADRRGRYNLACYLATVADELRVEEPSREDGASANLLAEQLLGRAVGDLRVAVSDLPLLEWARADPSLEPVRADPRGARLIAQARAVVDEESREAPAAHEEGDPTDGVEADDEPPARRAPPTRAPSPRDPPPPVRDAAYWLDRVAGELVALRLRPVRDGCRDAFLATGSLGLADLDESSELRRHIERAGTVSLPGLEDRLPAALAFELGTTTAMLLSDAAVPQLIVEHDQADAHREEIQEVVEYLLALIRRTEEGARSGRVHRRTGYPRDGVELSAWTGRAGEVASVVIGLYDPADRVRRWLDDVFSR
jgi:hypothetical protein